jgi:hypothetical protein
MKIAIILLSFLMASNVYAETLKCTADDGMIIRADMEETSYSGINLSNISIQRPGENKAEEIDLGGSLLGNLDTLVGGSAQSLDIEIFNEFGDSEIVFTIKATGKRGNPGAEIFDAETGNTQSVVCVEE